MRDRQAHQPVSKFTSWSWGMTVLLCCNACASVPDNQLATPTSATASKAAPNCARDLDHAAILKLAGEFWVDFHFEETVPLREGYTPAPAYEAAARELVIVVEDTPERIVMQHILVVESGGNPMVTKHWREDWQFEDTELLEFQGHRAWDRRRLSPEEVQCQWSQAVFEVDDGPRYEGTGVFRHENGTSTWTSNMTARPLPRREYTKRSDYDIILGVNRITVTPEGYSHEQDNEKKRLSEPAGSIVREIGVNRYVRTPHASFAVAHAYWNRTAPYWSQVREEWAQISAAGRLQRKHESTAEKLHEQLFALAELPPTPETRDRIREAIAASVMVPNGPAKATVRAQK